MTKTTAINQNTGGSFILEIGGGRTFYREFSEAYAVSVDGSAKIGYRGTFVTYEHGSFDVDGSPTIDFCLEGIARGLKASQAVGDFPMISWQPPQTLGV